VNRSASVSFLVKQPGSSAADALGHGLRARGVPLIVMDSAFDAVSRATRSAEAIDYLFVGVDYFGPDQFRLIPLVRREWPKTRIVAYYSEGFAHKGRIARLVGADVLLAMPGGVASFLETLPDTSPLAAMEDAPPAPEASHRAEPAAESPPTVRPPKAPVRRVRRPVPRKAKARTHGKKHTAGEPPPKAAPPPTDDSALSPPVDPKQEAVEPAPPPEPEPPAKRKPAKKQERSSGHKPPAKSAAQPQDTVENLDGDEELEHGRVLGTVELTDEELRVLLGEDDDA